jgi:hypothetical protein
MAPYFDDREDARPYYRRLRIFQEFYSLVFSEILVRTIDGA